MFSNSRIKLSIDQALGTSDHSTYNYLSSDIVVIKQRFTGFPYTSNFYLIIYSITSPSLIFYIDINCVLSKLNCIRSVVTLCLVGRVSIMSVGEYYITYAIMIISEGVRLGINNYFGSNNIT